MTNLERRYLMDTWGILVDYDGARTVESLKSLIDEAKDRLLKVIDGEVTKKEYRKER